jgi:predicted transcriptional regulator
MAMNLRLDDDDTALLRALAEADGVSMNEAARRAIRRVANDQGHQVHVGRATDEMLQRWGDVLDRLGKV